MPSYTVTDPTSGKTVTLTGDSPPTEQELEQIFSSLPDTKPAQAAPVTAADVPVFPGAPTGQASIGQSNASTNQPRSFLDNAGSAIKAGGVMLGNAFPATIGAIGGSIYGLLSGQGADEMARGAEQFSPLSTNDPQANEYMQKTGEFLSQLDPGFVGRVGMAASSPARLARDRASIQGAGQAIKQEASLVPKSVSDISSAVSDATKASGDMLTGAPAISKPEDIASRIRSKSTESDLAAYRLEGDKLVTDSQAKEAISQGWNDGTVQMLKTLDDNNVSKAKEMLDIADQGRKDPTYGRSNRPTDVIGEDLAQNIRFLKSKNTEAGNEIEVAANKLKDKEVDVSAPVNSFISTLEQKLNVTFKRDDKGNLLFDKNKRVMPIFKDSDIEGADYAKDQSFIQSILDRMSTTKAPNAYDVHRLKRSIDKKVKWGKSNNSNLEPDVEYAVKSLRHNLDDVLDSNFDDYNQANIKYKDTAQALGEIQDASGKKLNVFGDGADRQLGTLSKRLLSNVTSRQELENAIAQLQEVSAKYGNPNKADINKLAGFAADLEKVYQNSPDNAFAGQTAIGVAKGMGDIARSHSGFEAGSKLAAKTANYVMRRTPENTYKSLDNLLRQQKIRMNKK